MKYNISAIKAGFSEVVKLLANHYKFVDVKAKDGTIFRYEGETPQAGQLIQVVTPDGLLPVPDGDYELEDGTVLSVKESTIVDVKAPQAPEPEAEQKAQPDVQESASPNPKKIIETKVKESTFTKEDMEKIETLEKRLAELETKLAGFSQAADVAALKAEVEKFSSVKEQVAQLDTTNKQIFDIVKKMAEEPGAESAVTKKAEPKKELSFDERMQEFRNTYKI